jgi:transcriptional regulator with XRE-family HTH domain
MEFGDYFKELRIRSKMTLRHFCEVNGFDPGNISKIERGILPPPHSEEKLNLYAAALGVKPGDDEYLTFFDLAKTYRMAANIPAISQTELLNMLPVLFRTVDNKDITPEKLERIIELIKEETKK